MPWRARALAVLLSFCGPMSGAAQERPIRTVQLDHFTERLTADVKVGGRVVVGVAAAPDKTTAPSATLEPLLLLPRRSIPTDRPLCFQTVSRDGRYFAQGVLAPVALATGGAVRVQLGDSGRGSRHGDFLRQNRGHHDLAMLAFAGDCEAGSNAVPHVFIVDRVERPTRPIKDVMLLLNSERLDTEAVYVEPSGIEIRRRCVAIEEDRRTAFDTVCVIPTPTSPEVEVRVERRRYERRMNPVRFRLVVGG